MASTEKIQAYLKDSGDFQPGRGYIYLRDCIAVLLAGKLPSSANIWDVYSLVAKKHFTSPSGVERCVRRTLEVGRSLKKLPHVTNKRFILKAVDDLSSTED